MKGLEKEHLKEPDPKNRKNSENLSENAACEQKPLARKLTFVHKPLFSLL